MEKDFIRRLYELEPLEKLCQKVISELEDIQSDYYSSQQSAKGEIFSRACYIPEGIDIAIRVIKNHIKKEKN